MQAELVWKASASLQPPKFFLSCMVYVCTRVHVPVVTVVGDVLPSAALTTESKVSCMPGKYCVTEPSCLNPCHAAQAVMDLLTPIPSVKC